MSARAKAIAPLAVVIGILSFLWTELSLNFTFHWVTVQDNLPGDGSLGLPENFHLILPTAFISWGLFFAAGGDNAAFGKIFLATVFGSVAALVDHAAGLQDGGRARLLGHRPLGRHLRVRPRDDPHRGRLVLRGRYVPGFAAVFLWWIATGLDGYVPNGGGTDNTVAALGDPATAGIRRWRRPALDPVAVGLVQHLGHAGLRHDPRHHQRQGHRGHHARSRRRRPPRRPSPLASPSERSTAGGPSGPPAAFRDAGRRPGAGGGGRIEHLSCPGSLAVLIQR